MSTVLEAPATPHPASPGVPWDAVDSHIVYLKDVVVSFDGFRALDISEFAVHHNELRVVIGR
ncbi:MAG TPA: hypothetical protein VK324_09005, partial [Tepidisphaeraceae bacterium]|nr:hypothetical protein [Tepidisphaeraceae bacterium]